MSERLAYFITVIVAAIGWLVTYYVDRVTSSPTIEYAISETATVGLRSVTYRLTNVSRTHRFDDVAVDFLPRRHSPISGFDIVPVEPTSEGQNDAEWGPDRAQFTIERLMPGGAIDLIVRVRGPNRPKMFIRSSTPIRLTPATFETFLVKNEMNVIGGLLVFWLLALPFVISLLLNYESKKEAALARGAAKKGG